MNVFELWEMTAEEQSSLLKALDRVWSLAWTEDELAPLLRMRDALTVGCDVTVVHPFFSPSSTPRDPFAGPAGAAVREKIRIHAAQEANLATSTATEERMVMRHTPTGDIYVVRVSHGGEDNGDVTMLSGSMGPFRPSVRVDDLIGTLDGFQTFNDSPSHLEWLSDEADNFERLDLAS